MSGEIDGKLHVQRDERGEEEEAGGGRSTRREMGRRVTVSRWKERPRGLNCGRIL